MSVDVCCRFEEIAIMVSSIERGEWYTNSVCQTTERRARCGLGLSIILNLPTELLEIDRYAVNSGTLLLIPTMGCHHSLSPCTGSITPPTTVLPNWILTWSS